MKNLVLVNVASWSVNHSINEALPIYKLLEHINEYQLITQIVRVHVQTDTFCYSNLQNEIQKVLALY